MGEERTLMLVMYQELRRPFDQLLSSVGKKSQGVEGTRTIGILWCSTRRET